MTIEEAVKVIKGMLPKNPKGGFYNVEVVEVHSQCTMIDIEYVHGDIYKFQVIPSEELECRTDADDLKPLVKSLLESLKHSKVWFLTATRSCYMKQAKAGIDVAALFPYEIPDVVRREWKRLKEEADG